jgi:gliding motility-associated-like protein
MLGASGAISFSWSPAAGLNNVADANPNVTLNTPATYTVTGTDGNGCVNSDQISLTIIPPPAISASSVSMICPGSDVPLSATGTGGTYTWSPTTALNTSLGNAVTASPMTTTQYVVTLTDVCGVQVNATVNVPVEQLYTVNVGDDLDFCEGLSVVIDASITGSNPSISWYNNVGLIPGEDTNELLVSAPGTYAIQVETPLGCIYDDVVLVNEIAYPSFYLADTLSFCPGESAQLSIPGTWDQVQWSTGSSQPSIEVSQEGDFQVTVYNGECATTDEFHVYRVVLPVIELGPNREICQGQTAILTAGYNGHWSTGASTDSILVATEGTYTFEYTDEGCSVMDEVSIIVNPLPYIDAITTQFGCLNEPYTIFINDFAAGNYQWSDGSQFPYLVVDQPGDYWFMVTNECGSRAQTITVVFEDCDEAVYIPSSFTPDNDGINDVWKIISRNINSLSTKVFNRWGEVVFESNELTPVWVGGFDAGNTYVEDGLYFYKVEFERLDGQKDLREGYMFMIR